MSKKVRKDLAKSLQNITGRNYEECIRDVPRFTDRLGNFDLKKFSSLAASRGASQSSTIAEIQKITGKSYESTLMEMKMAKLESFKK